MAKKLITWAEVKTVLNSLTDTQLSNRVCFYEGKDLDNLYFITGIEEVEEDVYAHIDAFDDTGTLEDLKKYHGDQFDKGKYHIVTPKGTPFLTQR